MNNLFQENKKTFLFLLGLLIALLLVVLFLFYRPLAEELKSKRNEEDSLTQEIALLEIELTNQAEAEEKDRVEQLKHAKELPLHPELENMIRKLEEIEFISNSRFDSIGFSYDGTIPERVMEEEQEEEEKTPPANEEDEDAEAVDSDTETPVTVLDMEEKPENLHVVTMSMQVTSPDFEHFKMFVKEVEKQERMMVVSNMSFDRPLERDLYFEKYPDNSIEATITVATFYYD